MTGGDLQAQRPAGKTGWWSWGPVHHALHHLWMSGELTVESRRHFQKRFDLFERAIPAVGERPPVTAEEFARWHVVQSLHAMGAATEKDLSWYLSFPRSFRGPRMAALRSLIAGGEVVEVEIEGRPGRWLLLARDAPALRKAERSPARARGTALLSPFDSLMWHRERVQRLFGFDYKIEVYTPGEQRIHGYYTLPILHDGELIGRLDAKTHRAERKLEARHAHFEPWFAKGEPSPAAGGRLDPASGLAGVAEALASLGEFVGAEEVVLRRVTPQKLRPALAREIAARAPAG